MSNFSSSLVELFLVGVVAVLAPLLVYITRAHTLPAVVLEIVGGIIIGPQVLHWIHVDAFLLILSSLGLSYLLFLAGLEVDFEHLRGRIMIVIGTGFLLSFGLALLVSVILNAIGQVISPLLMAIILVSTSLGIVIPILKDAGVSSSDFGQLVIAAATLGEFGAIILLSFFYSNEVSSPVTKGVMLGIFAVLILVVSLMALLVRRTTRFTEMIHRLQDTTAQISVRIALTLLVGFVALASGFGAEAILGAFLAGVALRAIYRDPVEMHEIRPYLRVKLEAIGFGFLVPIFFITTGLNFDLHAFANVSTIVLVPVFLLALLFVRGVPAILYRRRLDNLHTAAAGLLQATSLTFIVAATQIGLQLGIIRPATSAALVTAGLLSVIIYPLIALTLLHRRKDEEKPIPFAEPM